MYNSFIKKKENTPDNFWAHLFKDSSNNTIILAGDYFLNNIEQFDDLLKFTNSNYGIYSRRASRAIYFIVLQNQDLKNTFEDELINILRNNDDIAVCRSILRIFKVLSLPNIDENIDFIYDYSIKTLINPKISVGIKSYAMHILLNFSKLHPEFIEEIIERTMISIDFQPENLKFWIIDFLEKIQKIK